jgi:hypothetical protein
MQVRGSASRITGFSAGAGAAGAATSSHHTQKLLHREVFTPTGFYTQKFLHREKSLHRGVFTHGSFYTEMSLH